MASITTPISNSQPLFKYPQFQTLKSPQFRFVSLPRVSVQKSRRMVVVTAEKTQKRYLGEAKGFVEEKRFVAMKLHTKDQAKEGEKEPQGQHVDGYLRFLVHSKLIYDTVERIVDKAAYPEYAELRNMRLERSASIEKDLEWFKQQGHTIPEPSSPITNYARYLEELSENDPQAYICHFYNTYCAHEAVAHKFAAIELGTD